MSSDVNDWNARIIDESRANGGAVGGMFQGAPMALLTTTGARTGAERVNPLVCLVDGGRTYVFASAGGAPKNPDWFHNLVANPSVIVEFGTDRYPATARVLEGAERDRVFAAQVALRPPFAEYQQRITRSIPVVELIRA